MKMLNPLKPQARVENLVVQELSDELLVYNLQTNKAFNLNHTSALIWQNCDGKKDISEIAKTLEKTLNQNVPDELVWLALDSLKKEGLVNYDETSDTKGLNRREVVKRIGFASMIALPMISSLVAPSAVNAQSGVPAAICQICIKKSDGLAACTQCLNALGTCFDNAGCGGGQLLTNVSCAACHSGAVSASLGIPFNGTISWVAS